MSDDKKELKAMADFYAERYDEVYFVRDLQADYIVAVECYPANRKLQCVPRHGRIANCFGYKDRLLSSRERLDKTADGRTMIGYESISGNDTRLASCERGIVGETPATPETLAAQNFGAHSPFEKYLLEQQVAAAEDYVADYELKDGVERFETFAVERVK